MDEKTFEERILLLEPKLYRTAYAILWNDADVADAMQECILKAWQKLGFLKDEERFEAWTARILINACRDLQRRNKHNPLPLEGDIGIEAVPQEDAADLGLREALHALPPKYRLPLLLHHMDGYTLAEIAPMLRVPVGTLKGRLYEARKQLKTLLEKEAVR